MCSKISSIPVIPVKSVIPWIITPTPVECGILVSEIFTPILTIRITMVKCISIILKTGVVEAGEGIVSRDVWDAAQKKLARMKQGKKTEDGEQPCKKM